MPDKPRTQDGAPVLKPLTIVHVSTQRGWHGGEEQARLLIAGLAQRGHRNLVLARRGGAMAERMHAAGVEVIETPGSGRGVLAMWNTRSALQRIEPDVLHFHDPHGLSGAGMAAWKLPVPAKIAARRVDFPIRSTWRYRVLADRVVAVSHAVAGVCRTSGIMPDQLRVVHDGVDPARARSGNRPRGRAALALAHDVPLLLTIATLTDHKGHTFLLQAMPEILAQAPGVILALAGDGELREPLESEARRLGVDKSVRFLGYRQDVPDLLKAADLFVMPSHLEGLCSTLLDVMFARVPIVSTTAGGIPEILGQVDRGERPVAHLVPPREPAALARAILGALGSLDQQSEMIERAAQRAESFTADAMVEKTLAIYREVLNAKIG